MLRRNPFDAEDALRRVLIANCDGVLIGRRVIHRLQFVQVLELNHDNAGCGCRAFEGDGLAATHNEFAARVGNRFGYEGEIFLIVPVLVLDCDLHDVVGGWLGLSMEGLNHSSAERRARDNCQPDCNMPINHAPPLFHGTEATVADLPRLDVDLTIITKKGGRPSPDLPPNYNHDGRPTMNLLILKTPIRLDLRFWHWHIAIRVTVRGSRRLTNITVACGAAAFRAGAIEVFPYPASPL